VTTADAAARYCRDLIAGLADAGVSRAFISPGSRNTPLTLAVVGEERLDGISVRDERSAAFMALGFAKATGVPAIVICTSGSAAAHYLPAIVEANRAPTPLIALTSDRPARFRGTDAPQSMDQIDLYGRHVKRFIDADLSLDGRTLGHALVHDAVASPAGPVHVNLSFDEPLLPDALPPPAPHAVLPNTAVGYEGPTDMLDSLGGNVLIVASGHQRHGFGAQVARIAGTLGAPVFADPQVAIPGPNVIHLADLLVAAHGDDLMPVLEQHAPDVVLRLGSLPTSKPLWQWLERGDVHQVLVDCSRFSDPLRSAAVHIDADPTAFLGAQVVDRVGTHGFVEAWRELDRLATRILEEILRGLPWPNEPEVARSLAGSIPDGSILVIASSRPIRDLDAFASVRDDIHPIANRGVNGIDGAISTAIGASLSGTPATLLLGDIAALHDATALAESSRMGVPLRIVVVNNDGGGIFSFLPQARSDLVAPEVFEQHWGTPHGLDIATIATAMGLGVTPITDRAGFRSAVARPIVEPELIEVHTDRANNVLHHDAVRRAIAEGLRGRHEVEQGS
jgi:2-succinyl-5-enolpyruvyl-6-hydroxy-3-cyclohexene-1-carboxylate synthase